MIRTRKRKAMKKILSNITKAKFIYKSKNVGAAGRGREPYVSSGWCSNLSALTFATS
jgi:hypothetical protein